MVPGWQRHPRELRRPPTLGRSDGRLPPGAVARQRGRGERDGRRTADAPQRYPAGALALDVVGSSFFGSVGLHATLGAEQAARARECLEHLLPGCAGRTLAELSYGMQRLVFIARALVADPPLLVLDEPCQGLDAEARARVLAAVDGAVGAGRTTLLYVTHQTDEVPGSISHVLELKAGRVVRSGPR